MTGLFYALVEKSRGAARFDAGMTLELKAKTIAAMLNVNLCSPKACRTLRVVLGDVTPCTTALKRANKSEALKPEVRLAGILDPSQEVVNRVCDQQLPDHCRVFSLSMDELVLGRGLGRRFVKDSVGNEQVLFLGAKEPMTQEQVLATPPARKDLISKAKLSLIVPNDCNHHLVCVGLRGGGATAHEEKLYNLGDSAPGGKVGLIRMAQKWARLRGGSFRLSKVRRPEEGAVYPLDTTCGQRPRGKGTLAAGVE